MKWSADPTMRMSSRDVSPLPMKTMSNSSFDDSDQSPVSRRPVRCTKWAACVVLLGIAVLAISLWLVVDWLVFDSAETISESEGHLSNSSVYSSLPPAPTTAIPLTTTLLTTAAPMTLKALPPQAPKPQQTFLSQTSDVGKKKDFGSVIKCTGQGSEQLSFRTKFATCASGLLEDGLDWLGHEWEGYSTVNQYAEQLSWTVARPLYNVALAKACSSMSQASQCGPSAVVREWDCPACKEAGFELTVGTHRFVHYEELGRPNATFIIVSRMKGQLPHPVTARMTQPLQHDGERCWNHCGNAAGYCAWCGVGNACCGNGDAKDPLECKGIWHKQRFHTCVVPGTDRTPAAVINKGKDCYNQCGKVSGHCNFCGAGNACCRQGLEDARECMGATGFNTDKHHECVTPAPWVAVPPPTADDIGCAVIVRGSHNKQNSMLDSDFMLESLPFPQCDGCQVHSGFHKVWRDVQPKVVQALGSLGCLPGSAQSRILLAGESFGAGVSTIAQYYLQVTGYTMEMQYNYGAPRVGNVAWAEHFNTFFDREVPLFRVTHAHDIVSRLPPVRFLDYRHVGAETFYPAEDPEQYVVCLGGEDFECQNRYDIAECLSKNVAVYNPEGSLNTTPGEAFDADHCHSGLAPEGDMCQCTLSGWWTWYRESGLLAHRWDSAPDNSAEPRLVPGAMIG